MAKQLTTPSRELKSRRIVDIQPSSVESKKIKPSISLTYMDVDKKYGLQYLCDAHKSHRGDRNILKELDDFLVKVRKYSSIEELVERHKPKDKMKNKDKASLDRFKKIQKDYDIETSDMVHIHCCGGGSGQFVLHGFISRNCFEVVWIDPLHEVHKQK